MKPEIAYRRLSKARKQAQTINDQILSLQLRTTNPDLAMELAQFAPRLSSLMGLPPPNYGAAVTPINTDETSLEHLLEVYTDLEEAVESADRAPTREQQSAAQTYNKTLQSTMSQWRKFLQEDVANLNAHLQRAGLSALSSAASHHELMSWASTSAAVVESSLETHRRNCE